MIKITQKKRIIRAFGRQYSTPLIKELNKARIKNADGNPFSPASIRQIVGGLRENPRVETKIMTIVKKKLGA